VRVLACGGRGYGVPPLDANPADVARAERERAWLVRKLDQLHAKYPVALLIHGAATGADTLAGAWAAGRGVPVQACPADWQRYGKRAGRIRNLYMLSVHNPDVVVAFPGGAGTAHMVEITNAEGVRVWQPGPPP
jgi:SLOG family YspA-like protein